MKKTNICTQMITTVFCFLCLSARAQTHIITLGRGEDCKGFNICTIQDFDKTVKLEANQTPANISVSKENRVLIAFQKSKMNDALFLKYFSTGFFVLDADFNIPAALAEKLKVSLLKKGAYKITATADCYEVAF